jgi:CDP-diacylglycerol--glycerol-3-phosphate 3-phosphatidyltransferase
MICCRSPGTEDHMTHVNEMRTKLISLYYSWLETILKPAVTVGISPNMISALSLGFSFVSAVCYAFGLIFMGGITVLVSGFLDTMDGTIARLTGKTSDFGALLDSTLDRYAEFFVFFGILIYYRNNYMFYWIIAALAGSIMVSYVKARAESLGTVRVVGLMQRPERLLLLSLGSLLNSPLGRVFPGCHDCILSGTLIIIAVLANITVIHRLLSGKKDLERTE